MTPRWCIIMETEKFDLFLRNRRSVAGWGIIHGKRVNGSKANEISVFFLLQSQTLETLFWCIWAEGRRGTRLSWGNRTEQAGVLQPKKILAIRRQFEIQTIYESGRGHVIVVPYRTVTRSKRCDRSDLVLSLLHDLLRVLHGGIHDLGFALK